MVCGYGRRDTKLPSQDRPRRRRLTVLGLPIFQGSNQEEMEETGVDPTSDKGREGGRGSGGFKEWSSGTSCVLVPV